METELLQKKICNKFHKEIKNKYPEINNASQMKPPRPINKEVPKRCQ